MPRIKRHLIKRQLSRIDAETDLHHLRRREALSELEDFLDEAEARGWRRVRVIVGKGWNSPNQESVIGPAVRHYLAENDYIFTEAKQHQGGEGALEVTLF